MKKIKLNKNQYALVDDNDYYALNQFKWSLGTRTVSREIRINKKPIKLYMHRVIMDAPKGKEVDHINHDFLDNQRKNLRICTRIENMGNIRKTKTRRCTSKYKGVFFNSGKNVAKYRKWQSQIMFKGKRYVLGTFVKEKQAALAYNIKAKELFGEFALLNKV